jgi:hypothetical protein
MGNARRFAGVFAQGLLRKGYIGSVVVLSLAFTERFDVAVSTQRLYVRIVYNLSNVCELMKDSFGYLTCVTLQAGSKVFTAISVAIWFRNRSCMPADVFPPWKETK